MIREKIFTNRAVTLPLTQDSTTFREDVANAYEGGFGNLDFNTSNQFNAIVRERTKNQWLEECLTVIFY